MVNKFIMLIGLPASGKSTWAKEYVKINIDTLIMSSDSIRKELFGDESIQINPNKVFELMENRTLLAINSGKSVIYDATNINKWARKNILDKLPKDLIKEAIVFTRDVYKCVNRDISRNRHVGEKVINRYKDKFEMPTEEEGFNKIIIFED